MAVYLIAATGLDRVKIGTAASPSKRLRELGTGAPAPLTLVATREGGRGLERAIHRAAAEWRVHREWFLDVAAVRLAFVETQMTSLAEAKARAESRSSPLGRYLADANLTASAFADCIGVSREAVRRYCSGERRPDWSVIARIQDATHGAVTANDFMSAPTDAERAA